MNSYVDLYLRDGGGNPHIYLPAYAGNAYFTNVGNVGIGRTSPATLLSNSSNNVNDGATGSSARSLAWQTNAAGYTMSIENAADGTANHALLLKTNSTNRSTYILNAMNGSATRFVVQSGGGVGVGTNAVDGTLEILHDGADPDGIFIFSPPLRAATLTGFCGCPSC